MSVSGQMPPSYNEYPSFSPLDNLESWEKSQISEEFPKPAQLEIIDCSPLIGRLKEIRNAPVSIWQKFCSLFFWTDAHKNKKAESILTEADSPGFTKEEAILERIQRAKNAASEGHKWIYDLEKARACIEQKQWKIAENLLLNNFPNEYVIAQLSHVQENYLKAYQSYSHILSESSEKNPNISSQLSAVISLITLKVVNDFSSTTDEERKIVAKNAKLKSPKQIFKLLKVFIKDKDNLDSFRDRIPVQHRSAVMTLLTDDVQANFNEATDVEKDIVAQHTDLSTPQQVSNLVNLYGPPMSSYGIHSSSGLQWSTLFSRIPDHMKTSAVWEFQAKACHHHEDIISAYVKAAELAPNEKERLFTKAYEQTKSLHALKLLKDLEIPKYVYMYAREIRQSNSQEALELIKKLKSSDKNVKELEELITFEKGQAQSDLEATFQLAKCYLDGTHGLKEEYGDASCQKKGIQLLTSIGDKHIKAALELEKLHMPLNGGGSLIDGSYFIDPNQQYNLFSKVYLNRDTKSVYIIKKEIPKGTQNVVNYAVIPFDEGRINYIEPEPGKVNVSIYDRSEYVTIDGQVYKVWSSHPFHKGTYCGQQYELVKKIKYINDHLLPGEKPFCKDLSGIDHQGNAIEYLGNRAALRALDVNAIDTAYQKTLKASPRISWW